MASPAAMTAPREGQITAGVPSPRAPGLRDGAGHRVGSRAPGHRRARSEDSTLSAP